MNRPRMLNERPDSRVSRVALLVIAIVGIVALLLVYLRATYTFAVEVFGSSMEDTIHEGDVVYALYGNHAARGDVIILDVSHDPAFNDGRRTQNIIKRLIAVEGDSVKCEGGVVYRKEAGGEYQPLVEPYTKGRTPDFAEVVLQEGEIYFLGDHRNVSHDSTEVGTRLVTDIIGVVPQWALSIKSLTTGLERVRASLRSIF